MPLQDLLLTKLHLLPNQRTKKQAMKLSNLLLLSLACSINATPGVLRSKNDNRVRNNIEFLKPFKSKSANRKSHFSLYQFLGSGKEVDYH
jgi:hypothetical protein